MRECEKRSEELGVSLAQLMDNAGEALARAVLKRCTQGGLRRCVILAGKGNNGGDGFVAAEFLAFAGVDVTVLLCCGEPATELAKAAFAKMGGAVSVTSEPQGVFDGCEVIVDCVFGTGFKGGLSQESADIFTAANQSRALRIACDVPSGCNAKSGQADERAFRADVTVTMHRKKLGLMLSPTRYFCGQVEVVDIGIPSQCDEENKYPVSVCDGQRVKEILPVRVPYGHKGTFGRLTAVCGSDTYVGAAGMSVLGAMRMGVGLCELCTTHRVITSLSATILECIYTQLGKDDKGFFLESNADVILEKTKNSGCLLVGCGIGHTKQTEKLAAQIVEGAQCPVVIDADGINSLAANIDVLQKKRSDVILTPHPKELSRLCGCSIGQVMDDPLGCALQLAEKYDITVLAKSSESIVVTDGGCVVTNAGNTALSKGGSGDILAGMTASLVAQGCKPQDACTAASYILGRTAELICEGASPRAVLPTDILAALPKSLKAIEE